MGWDYEIEMIPVRPFEKAALQFASMVAKLATSAVFENVISIRVYKYDLYLKKRGSWSEAVVQEYPGEIYGQFFEGVDSYTQDDDYLFEIMWTVNRYYFSAKPLRETKQGASLFVYDKGILPFYNTNPSGITYNALDYKYYYHPINPEAIERNLQRLHDELSSFAAYGIATMRGINVNYNDRPDKIDRNFLVYHAAPANFIADLNQIKGQPLHARKITRELLVQAADKCPEIEINGSQHGVFVYSKAGTFGGLTCFYEALNASIQPANGESGTTEI
jgi:hypothetical protein